jgi:hypothetical protein
VNAKKRELRGQNPYTLYCGARLTHISKPLPSTSVLCTTPATPGHISAPVVTAGLLAAHTRTHSLSIERKRVVLRQLVSYESTAGWALHTHERVLL